jgi:AbrB family looped-hinge helix DNA binding protein
MEAAAKVTSKGQVTLPKVVRDALAVKEGDEIVFRVEGSRAVLAKTKDFLELAGTVRVLAEAERGLAPRTPPHKDCQGGCSSLARSWTRRLGCHLTGDPPEMAARATAYLQTTSELLLTDVVAAETVNVLESFYEPPRCQGASAVRSLLVFEAIVCVDPALLLRAVEGMRPIISTSRRRTSSPAPRAPVWGHRLLRSVTGPGSHRRANRGERTVADARCASAAAAGSAPSSRRDGAPIWSTGSGPRRRLFVIAHLSAEPDGPSPARVSTVHLFSQTSHFAEGAQGRAEWAAAEGDDAPVVSRVRPVDSSRIARAA